MRDGETGDGDLIYLAAGPGGALLIGMALVPCRGLTTASNFTFAFMALTIVVAEFGGRRAAVATALSSALSLDFFLTEPYLRLTIEGKHDVIAFVGLTVCGLIAAGLGSRRGQRAAALHRTQDELALVDGILRVLSAEGLGEASLVRVLGGLREAVGLRAVRLRAADGRLLAASGTPPPTGPHAERLSQGGRSVGTLEVWGEETLPINSSRVALASALPLFSLLLSGLGAS